MRPQCGMCGFEKWMLDGPKFSVTMCRRCDTTALPGNQRVGPPKAPGTVNGWFSAGFGDSK